jgi:hypothetical protein
MARGCPEKTAVRTEINCPAELHCDELTPMLRTFHKRSLARMEEICTAKNVRLSDFSDLMTECLHGKGTTNQTTVGIACGTVEWNYHVIVICFLIHNTPASEADCASVRNDL